MLYLKKGFKLKTLTENLFNFFYLMRVKRFKANETVLHLSDKFNFNFYLN
jgi:hypothetical protein